MSFYGRKPIGTLSFLGGVPAVLTNFCRSWGKLLVYTLEYVCEPNETIHLDDAKVSFHSWARNGLAANMVGDWLLQLDTDHEFEPDLLARMLQRMYRYDLDVLVGLYQFKSPPHSPVVYGWHGPEGQGERLVPLASFEGADGPFEVAGAGAGCLLVRRRVFERIREVLAEEPFAVQGQSGEDIGFFHRLRQLGIKTYCDPRIECHHLVISALSMADYDPSTVPSIKVRIADAHSPPPAQAQETK